MIKRLIPGILAVLLLGCPPVSAAGENSGESATRLFSDSVAATVATPMYSAFHQSGKDVRVILNHGAMAPDGTWLPPGTVLRGRVLAASSADARSPGRIEVDFTRAFPPGMSTKKIRAGFAAPGGILSADLQGMVLHRKGNRRFEALEAEIRSREGAAPPTIRRFDKNRPETPSGKPGHFREVILDTGDQILIRFESR